MLEIVGIPEKLGNNILGNEVIGNDIPKLIS